MPGGRPPEPVPQDIADAVCEWIAEGKTLRSFCRQDGMPSRATIDRWRDKDEEFASRVARARDTGFDVIAEECVAIADDSSEDTEQTERGERPDTEWIQRSKLRVETRLKLLACWDPRRYGNKQKVEHSGSLSLEALVLGSQADEPDSG